MEGKRIGVVMDHSILLKGNKYGIVVVLDESMDFSQLLDKVGEKFKESGKFFDTKSKLAITFEGRILSNEEIKSLLDVISNNCDLQISYVIDSNKDVEEYFQNSILQQESQLNDKLEKLREAQEAKVQEEPVANHDTPQSENGMEGMFYKGTLRSGQSLESASSLIILGDVNYGAEVQAAGNIVVLGCIKGTAFAGCHGNSNAFVMALDMDPMQIRIANYIARSSDQDRMKKSKEPKEPKIAFVENENIYIEPVSKDVLNDISI